MVLSRGVSPGGQPFFGPVCQAAVWALAAIVRKLDPAWTWSGRARLRAAGVGGRSGAEPRFGFATRPKGSYNCADITTLARFRGLHTSMGLCFAFFRAARRRGSTELACCSAWISIGRAAVQRASSAFRGAADAPDGRRAELRLSSEPFSPSGRPRTERAAGEWPPCAARHAGRHRGKPSDSV